MEDASVATFALDLPTREIIILPEIGNAAAPVFTAILPSSPSMNRKLQSRPLLSDHLGALIV